MTIKQTSSSTEQHVILLPFYAEEYVLLVDYQKCVLHFDESFIPMIASLLFVQIAG